MRLRVFVIEPYEGMRDSLTMFVESLGHEAVAATEPNHCPHYRAANQICSREAPCGDALILGQHLPALSGAEFVERKLLGGCKGSVAHVAMICEPWSDRDRLRAKELGFRTFETPLCLAELAAWLGQVEAAISPDRKLAPLPGT